MLNRATNLCAGLAGGAPQERLLGLSRPGTVSSTVATPMLPPAMPYLRHHLGRGPATG